MDPLPQTPTPLPELPAGYNHLPKFHALVAILILLGIAAVRGVWSWYNANSIEEYLPAYTPRIESTTDWQTYRNDEYGFELKYPGDWIVSTPFSYQEGIFLGKNNSSDDHPYIAILPNGEFDAGLPSGTPTESQIIFAGEEAKQREWPNLRIINLLRSRSNWSLTGNRIEGLFVDNKEKELVDKILSTFKFIEPVVSTSPAPIAWKTYTSQRYDFSFQYPSDWNYELMEKRIGKYYYVARFYNPKFQLNVLSGSFEGSKLYRTVKGVLANGQGITMEFYHLCKNADCSEVDLDKPFIYPFALTQGNITLPEGLDMQFTFSPKDEKEAETIFKRILSTFKYN